MASSERFGYEWDRFNFLDENYELQFKNWLNPLTEKDFFRKSVLDAGCGMGRNSYWALKWGASKLTAFDFDERTIASAKKNLAEFKQARVLFRSIYNIDFNQEFDIVFCIGVLHHLENPKDAVERLYRAVRNGGKLIFWVYSYEGNEWIVRFVNPIRKLVTSRLPVSFVYYLSYLCSVPLYTFAKIFHGPTDYIRQISAFDLWHVHSIVFDQLIPKVANYWSRLDLEKLFSEYKNKTIKMPPNKSGWTVVIEK